MSARHVDAWSRSRNRPIAVVVGLCAHGLAIARSLARAGIPVVALEEDTSLPGTATRVARVESHRTTKGEALVETLVALADRLETDSAPVLFLTNDRMVRTVGERWDELGGRYRLSWSECRETVLSLLDKRNLQAHCRGSGLAYPRTVVFDGGNFGEVDAELRAYPVIAKPSRPLGTFKAIYIGDRDGLSALGQTHRECLPFLVQQVIPGGDEALKVAVFVMHEGRVLGAFEGRKLRSEPPCRGQTSVMQWYPDERVRAAGERFFAGLAMSGPVSVEFKEAPDGTLVVIEPTVGRTDYFVDACVTNGCDLPVLEYSAITGLDCPTRPDPWLPRLWCDTERDRFSLAHAVTRPARVGFRWLPVFPYLSAADPGPFAKACRIYLDDLPEKFRLRMRRMYHAFAGADPSPRNYEQ